ncbi:cyclic nucleotide-binding domain-containing protein [Spirochaeta dissipatitropha]
MHSDVTIAARSSKDRVLFLFIGQAFFTGLSFGLLYNVAYTSLVVQFGSAGLRTVYVLVGIIVPIVSLCFNALEEKLHLAKTSLIVTASFVLLFFLMYIALQMYDASWIIYTMMIVNMMGTLYLMMLRGSQAVEVYDARTIKNRYPKITGGEILAVVIAGLSAAPLASFLGALDRLLLIAGVSMSVALVFVWLIVKNYIMPVEAIHHAHIHEHTSSHDESGFRQFLAILRKKYTLLVFLFQMLTSMISLLVQYIVYSQAQNFFPSQAEMSQFIGYVKSGTTGLSFVFLTFLAGKLLVRFGMPLGIAGSPVGVSLALLAALVVRFFNGDAGQYFFIVIVVSQFIDYMMYSGFSKTAVQSAFQPLAPKERDVVHTFAQGIGIPVSYGLAGLLLMLFSRITDYTPVMAVQLTLGITALCGVAGYFLYKSYRTELSKMLSKRSIGDIELDLNDASTMQVIDNILESDDPWLVKSGFDLLSNSGHQNYPEKVRNKFTAADNPAIIRDLLERVEYLKPDWGLEIAEIKLASADDESVQAAALRAVCALVDEPVKTIQHYLNSSSAVIRSAAVAGLFLYGGIDGVLIAGNVFNQMLESNDPDERTQAAEILERAGIRNFYRPLVALLGDPEQLVVHAALRAAGSVAHPGLIPKILPWLDYPEMRADVIASLGRFGDELIPWIKLVLRGDARIPRERGLRLIRSCSRFSQSSLTEVLVQAIMKLQDDELLDAVYTALSQRGYRATGSKVRSVIQKEILRHAQIAARLLTAQHLFASGISGTKPLLSSLRDLYKQQQNRIFSRCALLYRQDDILGIQRKFIEGTSKQRALGSELLEVLLESRIRRQVIMVLENTSADHVDLLRDEFALPRLGIKEQINELCNNRDLWTDEWLLVCARYAASSLEIINYELEDSVLTTIERVMTLKAADIFSTIPDAVLAHIASIGEDLDIASKESFIRKGEMGDCMYIIRAGKVAVHDEKTTFAELGPGSVVGEMAVLDPEPRSASVTAIEDTSLLRIGKDAFDSVMADHPGIAKGVIHVLCTRVRSSNK